VSHLSTVKKTKYRNRIMRVPQVREANLGIFQNNIEMPAVTSAVLPNADRQRLLHARLLIRLASAT